MNASLGVSAEIDDGVGTYFVRDPRGGLLAERTPTSGTYYYLFDGHGSVTGLTNASGNVGASYQYDASGQLTWMNATAVGVDNPWRYVSAYQDGTGLYKMGARYYDPTLGRFTQQDPVFNPLDPRSWNRYAYVGNDPVNYTDPSGLMSCGWCSDAWDATGGKIFTCGDTRAAKVIDALSLVPPFGSRDQLAWIGSASGWAVFGVGNLYTYYAGALVEEGLAKTLIGAGMKASLWLTAGASAYSAARMRFC